MLPRAALILLTTSTAAALTVQLWLASHSWPALAWLGGGAFLLGLASGWRQLAPGYWILLGSVCLYPVAAYAAAGFQPGTTGVVLAGVLGLSVGARPAQGWGLPRSWSLALAFTASAIAVTWPIVALREMDFTLSQLFAARQAVTWQGIPPHVQVSFIAGMAATHMAGVLFVNAMVGRFREDLPAFRRLVLVPLAVSAGIAACAALMQMAVDISFLNPTAFAQLGRASGTMLDGNAFGAAAAMQALVATWLLSQSARPSLRVLAPVAGALLAAAVWATGSRTAALALVTGAPFLGLALVRRFGRRIRTARAVWWLVGALVAFGVLGSLAVRSDVVGPWSRLAELESAGGSISDVVAELRDRGGYGIAARQISRDAPLTGTGIGTFHSMGVEYAKRKRSVWLTPDNAQNWFRHVVAETGWVGAAGYFVWAVLFMGFVTVRLFRGEPAVAAAAGPLAGVLAASLLGVPTQEITVGLMFWALVAWVALASRPPAAAPRGWGATGLALAFIVVTYAAGTAYLAADQLRVPRRAETTGWAYEHGLSPSELLDGRAVRWAGPYAVTVFEKNARYVYVQFEVRHPDIGERPVEVEVRESGVTVLRTSLRAAGAVEGYLKLRPDTPFLMLEFLVDRTFSDPVTGAERGLLLHPFTFVDEAPQDTWRLKTFSAAPPPRNP